MTLSEIVKRDFTILTNSRADFPTEQTNNYILYVERKNIDQDRTSSDGLPGSKMFKGDVSKPIYEPRREKPGLRGFPTRSDTNRPVQSQKQARSLKFRI